MANMAIPLKTLSIFELKLPLVLFCTFVLTTPIFAQETKGKFQGDSNANPR
jgi:hypothetical protein